MQCANCGTENEQGHKFCRECGSALAAVCPNGHANPPGHKFCFECGASIDGVAAAERMPGVQEVSITAPLGRHIDPLPQGNRYLGFIFARADSPETVERALRDAHSVLEIHIEVGVAENGEGRA